MEIKNKYNLDDLVFVRSGDKIIHAKVNRIDVKITHDGCDFEYFLQAVDEYAQDYLDFVYEENDLCSNLEDIIKTFEVL